MSLRFILYNFAMIQMTIFLLWGCLESVDLIKAKKNIFGGFLLALVINIKILPIVIIPYLLYRKQFKSIAYTLIFSLIFLLLPSLYLGWSNNIFLLNEWWSAINPSNSEHLIESDLRLHSLTALIPPLLTETSSKIKISRNIIEIGKEAAILALNITRVSIVFLSFYFIKWPPFVKEKSRLSQLRELAYIILTIPLIFPHQQKYAFALAIPAIFYLCHFIVVNFQQRKEVIKKTKWFILIAVVFASFILTTLSTDGLIGRELSNITQHFKTITWGTILLIFALMLADPQTIIRSKKRKSI